MTGGLDQALAGRLGDLLGSPVDAVRVTRSAYSTSAPIDDLDVTFTDGAHLSLVRKDLAWSALLPSARSVKPQFLHDPAREISAYRDVLPTASPGPATSFGSIDEPDDGRQWLFLERLTGVRLCEIGDLEPWRATARWIAEFHRGFEAAVEDVVRRGTPLLRHGRQWLGRWIDRAVCAGSSDTSGLRFLRDRIDALADRLGEMSVTIVHGELYASNVIVEATSPLGHRVSPIDWEMIAVAPGLVDLAALTAGSWPLAARSAIEAAYCDALGRTADPSFAAELDACRLALCIQWLGWMPGWRAPDEHRHDWCGQAVALAEELNL